MARRVASGNRAGVSGVFQVYTVKPKATWSGRRMSAMVLNALKKEGKAGVALMKQTVSTWDSPPAMRDFITFRGGEISLVVIPTGDQHDVDKWVWLDKGTQVRYATMTRDFVRKTAPSRLQARPGTMPSYAGVAFISKKHPRKGIEPRNWTRIINRRMRPRFLKAMREAIKEGIKT